VVRGSRAEVYRNRQGRRELHSRRAAFPRGDTHVNTTETFPRSVEIFHVLLTPMCVGSSWILPSTTRNSPMASNRTFSDRENSAGVLLAAEIWRVRGHVEAIMRRQNHVGHRLTGRPHMVEFRYVVPDIVRRHARKLVGVQLESF
jgi:hypothetical protein